VVFILCFGVFSSFDGACFADIVFSAFWR
jgi:hypothetical protein